MITVQLVEQSCDPRLIVKSCQPLTTYGVPNMGYYDGPGGGAGLLARTLDLNFGVQPDHYGVVNMLILQDMIDAIGGVDIYLENGIDARDSAESNFLLFFAFSLTPGLAPGYSRRSTSPPNEL